jgi:prolyl oligopeptidase
MSRIAALLLGSVLSTTAMAADEDPYLWLEEVDAPRALDWVKAQNAVSTKELAALPEF